ncbi:hypothetical protein GW915_08080 [bacterium]|nr:hypothetical protein [bacterium]
MTDFGTIDALFPFEDSWLWAQGPWAVSTKEPKDAEAPCFLKPNFSPFEPRKWLRPARWGLLQKAFLKGAGRAALSLNWAPSQPDLFFEIVKLVQERISNGRLNKAVPVYPWKARLDRPLDLADFLDCFVETSFGQTPYYLRIEEKQLVGLTPELLFSSCEGRIETQAVAGTVKAAEAQSLLESDKDLREHEFVCQYLSEKLRPLGKVVRDQTKAVVFGKLAHLVTSFSANGAELGDAGTLLESFHPTPALGVAPKDDANLHFQDEIREKLKVSPFYGAPVGFVWKNQMRFWVGIRNVIIHKKELTLHTGCGVIAESKQLSEWNELLLKREAVCKILNLAT